MIIWKNYQKALTGSKAVIDLKLEDTGKLLLGSAGRRMDLSWLNNVESGHKRIHSERSGGSENGGASE
ncbi:MAG: hypothetical protein ACLR2E_16350 [Lachnospiraceae bacterium]